MISCEQCGTELVGQIKFCSNCGAATGQAQPDVVLPDHVLPNAIVKDHGLFLEYANGSCAERPDDDTPIRDCTLPMVTFMAARNGGSFRSSDDGEWMVYRVDVAAGGNLAIDEGTKARTL